MAADETGQNAGRAEGGAFVFESSEERADRERREAEKWDVEWKRRDDNYKRRQLWLNVLLALIGTAGIGISVWNAVIAQRSADAARSAADTAGRALADSQESYSKTVALIQTQTELMKAQADAAKLSAHAASQAVTHFADANKFADTTYREQQRARVYVQDFQIRSEPTADNPTVTVDFRVINRGATPAILVTTKGRIGISDQQTPPVDWTRFSKGSEPQQLIAYPNLPLRHSATWSEADPTLRAAAIKLYLSGTARLYIAYRVDYDDVFGKRHWISACAHHGFNETLPEFNLCPHGQDFDRE